MLANSRGLHVRALSRAFALSSSSRASSCLGSRPRRFSTTTTATTSFAMNDNDLKPTHGRPAVAVNQERTQAEIQTLVQQRVRERNAWTINGTERETMPSLGTALKALVRMTFKMEPPPSQAHLDEVFPVLPIDWEKIEKAESLPAQIQITWLGHSSLLIQMHGYNILTDPVFSDRCSPSQWFGPKRFRPPPCSVAELCSKLDINLVLISHNHYDHLDHGTVCELAAAASQNNGMSFVVPLGLSSWFRRHVSSTIDIYELDWHEHMERHSTNNDDNSRIRITALPMRHWSNRTGDRDQTLWCGYSIHDLSTNRKVLFPGDTAWFNKLVTLGEHYGPWDVAAIPIGAYEPRDFMKYAHINVPEAVRMKEAVRATAAVPIHWGTFPLTSEPVLEPREKLVELMQQQQDSSGSFEPWLIGEIKQF